MADNITVTPGTGATIAAESLGGALVQRVKPVIGATDVDGGDISASNPMPISGSVSTQPATVNVGQQTTNTTAVQLSASSTVPTNGIIVEALSSNSSESIFIGGSGVTTSNGYELQTGAAIAFTCNLNTLYIISATSTTNKVCWTVD